VHADQASAFGAGGGIAAPHGQHAVKIIVQSFIDLIIVWRERIARNINFSLMTNTRQLTRKKLELVNHHTDSYPLYFSDRI